jgi:PKD repeat protein
MEGRSSITIKKAAVVAAVMLAFILLNCAPACAAGNVYVSMWDYVDVYSASNDSFLTRIHHFDGSGPMAASPDGRWLYVADAGHIKVIDTASNLADARIPFNDSSSRMSDMVMGDDSRLYALDYIFRVLTVFDTVSREGVGSTFVYCSYPALIDISPDGRRLYVAAAMGTALCDPAVFRYNLTVYDAHTLELLDYQYYDMRIYDLAVSRDGDSLYVLGYDNSRGMKLLEFQTSDLWLQHVYHFPPNSGAREICSSPDGDLVYVCQHNNQSVLFLDSGTLDPERAVSLDIGPDHMTISTDGRKLYLMDWEDKLRVVDTSTYRVNQSWMSGPGFCRDMLYVQVPATIVNITIFDLLLTPTPRPTISLPANTGDEQGNGDINGDGKINSLDALIVLKMARSGPSPGQPVPLSSDARGVLKLASGSGLVKEGPPGARPVADFTVSYDADSLEYTFDASASTGAGLGYDWDFGDGYYGSGLVSTHTYRSNGVYDVALRVTDSFGRTSSLTKAVEVEMVIHAFGFPEAFATEANFTLRPLSTATPGTMLFDGSSSTGVNLSFAWDFGDGAKGSGQTVTHRYLRTGTYTAILTVHDSDGSSDSKKGTVRITSVSGIAGRKLSSEAGIRTSLDFVLANFTFDKPAGGGPGDVIVNGSASLGDGLAYAWDLGDGSMGTGVTLNHTFAIPGDYNVTLTVTNAAGLNDSMIRHLSLSNGTTATGPVARFIAAPMSGAVPLTVKFNAYESTDPYGISEYSWDFGDGAKGSGMTPTHQYTVPGKYRVTLTIRDSRGLSDSTGKTIVANSALVVPGLATPTKTPLIVTPTSTSKPAINKPPVALFNHTYKAPVLNLTAARSYDTDGKIVQYAWSMRNKKTNVVTDLGTGVIVKKTMTATGIYEVTLRAMDDDKAVDTYNETITITAV